MPQTCPLCKQKASHFYTHKNRIFHQCNNCRGVFLEPTFFISSNEEEKRYRQHNNDVEDSNYQKFVSPITSAILNDFSVGDMGLDFGAGTGPVISKVLNDSGFEIVQYDPFFHQNPEPLKQTYDYIACCEVMEHFHNPYKEFKLLKGLLKPNGKLYCMTNIYNKSIDFDAWYYKNDPTHVFMYQEETIHYLANEFNFSNVEITGGLIVFTY